MKDRGGRRSEFYKWADGNETKQVYRLVLVRIYGNLIIYILA